MRLHDRSQQWPLERVLFALAGTMTLLSAALAALVSPWFLLLTAFVGVNQLGRADHARLGGHGLAVAQHHKRRDRADPEASGEVGLVVDVDLGEAILGAQLGGALELRRHSATRAAPGCPEVDHRQARSGERFAQRHSGESLECFDRIIPLQLHNRRVVDDNTELSPYCQLCSCVVVIP